MWNAFVLTFVLTAAVADLWWRQIPRWLTTAALAIGLVYHGWQGGFWAALLAAFLGFSIGLLFFRMGAVGGGDVKLMAALGGVLGLTGWFRAMTLAVFIAGGIALVQAVHQRALRRTLGNVAELLAWNAAHPGQPHPEIHVGNRTMLRAPFGAAVALGAVVIIMVQVWR